MLLEAYNELLRLLNLGEANDPPEKHQIRAILATAEARRLSIKNAIDRLRSQAGKLINE